MEVVYKQMEKSLVVSFQIFMDDYLKENKESFEEPFKEKQFENSQNQQEPPLIQNTKQEELKLIYLNVGGKRFTTTQKTLQKYPGSYLDKLSRQELPKIVKDKDGYMFLNSNGIVFEYILEYLRHGELIYPTDKNLEKKMKKVIKEFGLNQKDEKKSQTQ